MFDLRSTFGETLSEAKLFEWHVLLFAGSTNQNLRVGWWRTHAEPMQVISGYQNKQRVHYEAPPAAVIPAEMAQFISWFNRTAPGQAEEIVFPGVRAAIAHLYFESLHPFEDGNGRIGRAIAEKALFQGFGYPGILSLSQAIETDKSEYYAALHAASVTNEITPWLEYFLAVIIRAQNAVENQISFILKKSVFFDQYEPILNARQLKVIKRMLQEGPAGFQGGINARKYMAISGASKATATRDLQDLLAKQIVEQIGSGRSVRYELSFFRSAVK
jgi:Fic family protein